MARNRFATWAIGCTVTNGQWPTIRTFKETSHWPFVTASACLGGPDLRRYLWGPAAGASTLSCIWPQPSGPLFKGVPSGWRQTAPKFSTHAEGRLPHPILPARPCVGAACVTGMGGSMGENFGAGITLVAQVVWIDDGRPLRQAQGGSRLRSAARLTVRLRRERRGRPIGSRHLAGFDPVSVVEFIR
jgi:hypothetical protein